uniref:Phosphofurin acidic cluster sorting protein 1/2 C-terminal domain-containing protein n=1 Tax=Timema douglasi TaxID=61478 RepID=A0A7R8ZHF8_TIMDO|nr:unnamed protein product [Timema douglasi]
MESCSIGVGKRPAMESCSIVMRLGKKKEKEKEMEPKSQVVDGVSRLICSAKTHSIPLKARMREMAILSGSLCLVCPKSPPPPWLCVLTALCAGAVEDVDYVIGYL